MTETAFSAVSSRASYAPWHPCQADCAGIAVAEWLCGALIGTIRRECLDHVIVFGEAHLRRVLSEYAGYYNGLRTHRALNRDAPIHRKIERVDAVASPPVLGGLHHQYCRI